jgi:transcription initiation factor IIF auxiliary subunit
VSLTFNCEVIRDAQGKIKYQIFHSGGREHYHISIWLEGSDIELDAIEKVEYELHPTFRNRNRNSSNRSKKFGITFWTWGMFAIKTTIHYKKGTTEISNYYLSYELPNDDGTNYVQVQGS